MANVRFISKNTPAKTANVAGYIFRAGTFYVVDDRLATTLDQLEVSSRKVFDKVDKAPSVNKVDLTSKMINEQGKLVNKPANPEGLPTITKPDTTKANDEELTQVIKELTSYEDLDREELESEAKARKLTVRSNMKNETIIDMLKEHDLQQSDAEDSPKTDKQVTIKV